MAMNFKPTTEIKLAGHEFVITHWSPMKTMKNLPKIGKIVAVPIAAVGGEIAQGGANLSEILPTALMYLFENLDDAAIVDLFDLLFEDVSVDGMGGKLNPDEVFATNPAAMLKLAAKVLECNYGSFFTKDGLGDLKDLLTKMVPVAQLDQMGQEAE